MIDKQNITERITKRAGITIAKFVDKTGFELLWASNPKFRELLLDIYRGAAIDVLEEIK